MAFTKIEHYEKEHRDEHHDSALNVSEGVSEQPITSPYFVRKHKPKLTVEDYVAGIRRGDITILSQAITMIESNNPCLLYTSDAADE